MGILNELRKRAIVAIAEPVAVAVAAAVEQTLRQSDDRLDELRGELHEAKRDLARSVSYDSDREGKLEAAIALANRVQALVAKGMSMDPEALTHEELVALRKLDQLADIVLGQS